MWSAYTTSSGRPAHPSAFLWKVTHIILLEVEFWMILSVSVRGEELRSVVSNHLCSLQTHRLPPSWAGAQGTLAYNQT